MKRYLVIRDGRESLVEVTLLREHIFRVVMNGAAHEIDVRQCTADSLSLLMDNRASDFSYGFIDDRIELHSKCGAFRFEVLNERKQLARRARRKQDEAGPETVRAFMPGKIVKVHVAAGDKVAAGDGLLIMEAMKMENEIKCRKPGVVRTVHVGVGQTVDNGALLIEIE
jgi:biotin carboxyl carrier protein